jgi:predicted dehydrogenase
MTAGLTRRQFLGTAAMAMTANTVHARAVSANSRLALGVIGCGGIATADVGCFLQHPEIEIPIVCDVDDARFKNIVEMVTAQRGKAPETVRDFRRVIDRKDVDLLLVCTPDHWHALPTVYGCQAGKDVYVEKPLGRTIGEGRAMLEAMRQNKRVVQMGTQGRSSQHYAEAVEFIQSGQLGKVRLVRAWAYLDWVGGIGNPPDSAPPEGVDYDLWLGPAPLRPFNPNRFHFNFRWFWDYAGGLMTDWGVHLLNVCLWAMGPEAPLKVMSCGGKRVVDDNTETPDTQFTVYDFPSYTLIWEHQMQGGLGPNGRPHGMYFNGSHGAVLIDDTGWEIIPEPKKDTLKTLPRPENEPADHVFPAMGGIKRPAGRDPRARHVRNFLDCVASREQPVEHLAFAHQVSTVAHLGNIALRSNSEVHWDSENERVRDNPAADALVFEPYRAPWTLPYAPR